MGKEKKLKKETVKRINDLIIKYDIKTPEELKQNDKFQSLHENYMNSYEKTIEDQIISGCFKKYEFDEILLLVKNLDAVDSDEESHSDLYNETMFMISQQKVIDVDPVGVIINDSEDSLPNASLKNQQVCDMNDTIKNDLDKLDQETKNKLEVSLESIIANAEKLLTDTINEFMNQYKQDHDTIKESDDKSDKLVVNSGMQGNVRNNNFTQNSFNTPVSSTVKNNDQDINQSYTYPGPNVKTTGICTKFKTSFFGVGLNI